MKKQFLFLFFFMAMITVSAQKMAADGYTVSLSDKESSQQTISMMGDDHSFTKHTGTYTIKKGSKVVATQKYTMMVMAHGTTLNIQSSDRRGDSMSYLPASKKFEFYGKEYSARDTGSTDNIILSGLLVYAAQMEKNK